MDEDGRAKRQCELRSWENVYTVSRKLAEKIKQSGFQPDVVIGLARGGWVPARNICDFLGVKDLISMKMEHWGVTAHPDGKAKMKYPVKYDLKGKKVLIVDDCADTGESLYLAKEHVKKHMKPKEAKTATMQVFDVTPEKNMPDIWVEKLSWRWIIYPWNFTEDVINLINKLLDNYEKMHIEKIKSGLEEYFDIEVDIKTLEGIMTESERRKNIKRIKEVGKLYWQKIE